MGQGHFARAGLAAAAYQGGRAGAVMGIAKGAMQPGLVVFGAAKYCAGPARPAPRR